MLKFIGVIALASLFIVGLTAVSGADKPESGAGSQAVYDEIATSTDCDSLQTTFDRADANHERAVDQGDEAEMEWTIGYMNAAHDRMEEIGCY